MEVHTRHLTRIIASVQLVLLFAFDIPTEAVGADEKLIQMKLLSRQRVN